MVRPVDAISAVAKLCPDAEAAAAAATRLFAPLIDEAARLLSSATTTEQKSGVIPVTAHSLPITDITAGIKNLRFHSTSQLENSAAWTPRPELSAQVEHLVFGARASTVRVTSGSFTGSGFIVSQDHDVLTAHHVVKNHRTVDIWPNALASDNTAPIRYRVHQIFGELDTVWLKKLDNPDVLNDGRVRPFDQIANADSLPVGSAVAIFGNPKRNLTMSPALWTKERVAYGNYSAFPLSSQHVVLGEALPGHSGGAALTLDGRLLGMVKATQAASGKDHGMTLLVPYTDILKRSSGQLPR